MFIGSKKAKNPDKEAGKSSSKLIKGIVTVITIGILYIFYICVIMKWWF